MTRSGLVTALILVALGLVALRCAIRGGARSIEEIPLLAPPPPPPPAEAQEMEAADTRDARESSAEAPPALPEPLHIAGATPDTVTVIQLGASIRGRVVGAAFSFGQDEFGKAVRPEDGVSLGPIPPGSYTFTATKPDRTSVRQDLSVSGDEQTVTLTFDG